MTVYKQSYASGTSDVPLIGSTIGVQFDAAAEKWGDRDALIVREQNIYWSWSDLKQRVDDFAAGLMDLGLQQGDRIGIWSPNNSEWTITQFAAAKAGLILVNINPAYRLAELEYALNKVGCTALVSSVAFKTSDYLGMIRELSPELESSPPGKLKAEKLPSLRHVILIGGEHTPGTYTFREIVGRGKEIGHAAVENLAPKLQFDDPINIQFTSGTTGAPKGATLTHHNILNNGFFVGRAQALEENDRICIPVPLYHCFGMVMGNLASVTHGAAMVYPGEGFDPLSTLQTVSAEKCTALYGVPTMFISQLQHPEFDEFDLSSLRTGIMAGSPCPVEVMKQVIEKMHMRDVTIAYGMTETSPVSTQTSLEDPVERRVSTIGRIQPHLEVKIIDGGGHIVAPDVTGELCTRGYSVMRGYWDDVDRTAEAIDVGGWMHTGDLATMDQAGYFNIVGRIKDMVIRGGENLYPREIEEFLYRHPKIADVQIFGVPDDKYGEELCAWIRLADGEEAEEAEILSFCEGQIAHQKVPRYIRFVDKFPMTVTGKVQKFVMRERMIEELKLSEEGMT
ncbi:MAG: AMP-binding protein [Pseudomonadota bacterium]|nr:AMP-binding protein [Pseudomonadota bacterium]